MKNTARREPTRSQSESWKQKARRASSGLSWDVSSEQLKFSATARICERAHTYQDCWWGSSSKLTNMESENSDRFFLDRFSKTWTNTRIDLVHNGRRRRYSAWPYPLPRDVLGSWVRWTRCPGVYVISIAIHLPLPAVFCQLPLSVARGIRPRPPVSLYLSPLPSLPRSWVTY